MNVILFKVVMVIIGGCDCIIIWFDDFLYIMLINIWFFYCNMLGNIIMV